MLKTLNLPPVKSEFVINQIALVVMDSVGVGALPDAADFGDVGSNTLGHIRQKVPGIKIPNLLSLGIGRVRPRLGFDEPNKLIGAFGSANEVSPGKDTTTGHWEITGVELQQPFPTFPNGFPSRILNLFKAEIGSDILGNEVASGTEIINRLGDEHVSSGKPIVYTSADSVFQIAAHEEIISLEELYEMCRFARTMLSGSDAVGRVIARPFVGTSGNYQRTANRKDFSLQPPGNTVLNCVEQAGKQVMAVGKISDIMAGSGITQSIKTADNMAGVDATIKFMQTGNPGLIFTNLVDFDSNFGHRRDVGGYAGALEEFDLRIPELLAALQDDGLLIITADHGNDPTYKGTDHTREYIPILCYGKTVNPGADFGTRSSFADIGATIADLLGVESPEFGQSFSSQILTTISN